MAEGTSYQVIIAQPAQIRNQNEVLSYLIDHFSLLRAIEIDANMIQSHHWVKCHIGVKMKNC